MRRKTKAIPALAALCLAALLACGPAAHADGITAATTQSVPGGAVKIWCGANGPENEVMRQLAAVFTGETGIPVEVVERTTIFGAAEDVANSAKLDDSPDIVYMQAPDIGSLVTGGYLAPLEITDDLKNRYAEAAFSAFTLNGQCYGMGYNIATYGLIYNKKLITEEQLPKTWNEFFEAALRLTKRDASGEYMQRGTLMNLRNLWFVYPIMREYGGYYYGQLPDGSYNAYDVGLDNAGMLRYVEKMKECMAGGLVLNTRLQSETNIVSEFGAGKVAMMLYGLWSADYFQQQGVEYGIAPLPAHSDGSPSLPLTTVEGFVLNQYSDHMDEAKQFLSYILGDANQQRLVEAGNGGAARTGARNPANLSVMESEYVQSDSILRAFSAIGMDCEPFPNIPEGTIWYNYTTTSFGTIFYGDSKGKPVDAEAALKTLADAIRADVALMNKSAQRVEPGAWPTAVAGSLLVLAAAAAALWAVRRRRKALSLGRSGLKLKTALLAWGLMLPLLILLGMFYVYPIAHNIWLSFTDYSGIHLNDYGFIGAANYRDIFTSGIDGLLSMVVWTFAFAISVVGLSFLLGTFVATILDHAGVQVARVYRVIYILPWVIPAVITLLMWQGLLETDGGFVNQALGFLGLPKVPWLSDPVWARVSSILVMVWFSFPYFMVVALSLLKSIPKDYYEAARIDGAGAGFVFRKITLPLVFQAMVPTMIMGFIMQFNQFGIYLLTQGGPASDKLGAPGATDLLISYIFNLAFNTKRYGVAAAYSVILFVFIAAFALAVMARSKKRQEG